MNRFFIRRENIFKGGITIEGDDVQHIKRVLRLEPGDKIMLCDGEGTDYLVSIDSMNNHSIRTVILEREESKGEASINVVLYQGVPKSTKMDLILQKCTEMGIARVVPVMTARTVVKLESEKDERRKVERWTKIAEEAAKQSARGKVPVVDMPRTFEQALEDAKKLGLVVLPYELEDTLSLKEVLQRKATGSIGFFIGPEGGFEANEVEKAKLSGVIPVTLGKRILRTETAGFAVLTSIMYQYDQME